MKNLTKVIGLAPSELPREDLIRRIREEHKRVALGFESYKAPSKRRKSGGSRKLSAKAFTEMLKEAGLTLEEYQELQKLKEELKSGESVPS